MNRRLTHILVSIVTTVVIIATVAFSVAVTLPGRAGIETRAAARLIPRIAHPVNESLADCARCHRPDRDDAAPGHATYGVATCLSCHSVAAARADAGTPGATGRAGEEGMPATVPHPVAAPYDNCVACHAIGGNLGMPQDHADHTNDACGACHAGPRQGEPVR